MKEMHCHILPTIDDGSKSLEMAYEIWKCAKEVGIKDIILSILIMIVVVYLLITILMKYSMNKINKQNIIETIRNDNI